MCIRDRSKADLLDGMIQWSDNADTSKWYYLAVQEATNLSLIHIYRNEDGTRTVLFELNGMRREIAVPDPQAETCLLYTSGAASRNRTGTVLRPGDFKSPDSVHLLRMTFPVSF